MSVADEKEFVLKHVFTNVKVCNDAHYGKEEKHFNIPWRIHLKSTYISDLFGPCSFFHFYLECLKSHGTDEWSIGTNIELILLDESGVENSIERHTAVFSQNNSSWMLKEMTMLGLINYIDNNTVTVKMKVKITKMSGIKKKLSDFTESTKEFSDVALIVNAEKFHVSKKYLAYHSAYFKSLFMGNFDESKQSEIELKDIELYDFQNFLEVLYGEPAVDEDTIDGILKLADMYDSKTAIRRCEEFLVNKSERSLEKKFEIAIKYKMDELKKKCISKIETKDDIRSIVPEDADQLEPWGWKESLNLALSF